MTSQLGPKQTLIVASSMTSDLRGPKSSMNIQHIGKENEEDKEPQSRTHWREMIRDHGSVIHQHTQAGSQKNERRNNSETHQRTKRNAS
jgi:hypothetical protein